MLSSAQNAANSPASGLALFKWNSNTNMLVYMVHHNVAGPTAAHIHGPATVAGVAGVLHGFSSPVSPITGNWTLTATQAAWLEAGMLYVNVHSAAFPGGEARGQIMNKWQSMCILMGSNEVPANAATTRGYGMFTWDPMTKMFWVNITHDVTATAAHIHGPANMTQTASVILPLTASGNMYSGAWTLSETQAMWLMQGKLYANIHSSAFPSGEVRCQVSRAPDFNAWLDASQAPPSTGKALGAAAAWHLMGDDGSMWLSTTYWDSAGNGATATKIHGPAPMGFSTTGLYSLSNTRPMFMMSTKLSNTWERNHVDWLWNMQLYINVTTATWKQGAIRGQLLPIAPFSMDCPMGYYMSGSVCMLCPPGMMSNTMNAASCTPCPANMWSFRGMSMCVPCPPGTVALLQGSETCACA